MPHNAGVDQILGTGFMIPAGVWLDLFNATAKLPDEIAVLLLRSAREVDESTHGDEVIGEPIESMRIESRLFEEFQLQRKQPERRPTSFGLPSPGVGTDDSVQQKGPRDEGVHDECLVKSSVLSSAFPYPVMVAT